MAVVKGVLHDGWAVLWKICSDEFSDHATEVGGHQHVFQSRHLFSHKFRIHSPQKVGKVRHCLEDILDRDSKRDLGIGIEILK
jgi:hypothetical protein